MNYKVHQYLTDQAIKWLLVKAQLRDSDEYKIYATAQANNYTMQLTALSITDSISFNSDGWKIPSITHIM